MPRISKEISVRMLKGSLKLIGAVAVAAMLLCSAAWVVASAQSQRAQASAPFGLGGCGQPTNTPAPTATKSVVGVEPRATAASPKTTEISGAQIAVVVDAGRDCIPTHAGAPVRLCPTGSGWWIYDSATGQILHDAEGRLAYVPFLEELPIGQAKALFASERLNALWLGDQVAVWTRYGDGKAYVFSIFVGGRVAHWQW